MTFHTGFVLLLALWSRYYPVFKKEELKGMPFSLFSISKPTWIFKQRYAMASLHLEFLYMEKLQRFEICSYFSWYLEMPSCIQKVLAFWKHFQVSCHSVKVGHAPSTESFCFFFPPLICDVQVHLPSLLLILNLRPETPEN